MHDGCGELHKAAAAVCLKRFGGAAAAAHGSSRNGVVERTDEA